MNWSTIIEDSLRAGVGREAIIYALAAIGLNVHFGYTGLLNFGQVGFMAIGGYGVAISVLEWGLPLGVGVLVGIGAATALALLLGLPTLRLRADYLAIVTIAASEIFRLMVSAPSWRSFTGGSDGLSGFSSGFYDLNPFSDGTYGFGPWRYSERTMWVLARGLGARPPGRPARVPAHAQPVGPRPQGDPRGRGRGAGPRQERVQLQDAEPHPRRRHRLGGRHVLDRRPGRHRARAASARSPRSMRTPRSSSAAWPASGGRWWAR